MKLLYVTDRRSIGDDRFESLIGSLRDAPGLSVQLREKEGSDRSVLERASSVRAALGDSVPLFVNSRFDVARAAGATGVHLPADGLPPRRVRVAVPRGFRVGVSTHSTAEAVRAFDQGADLVLLGPIFATPSKARFGPPLGTAALEDLPPLDSHGAEVFAIGGIDESRLTTLRRFAGRLSGVAGIRLFQESGEARALVERIAAE
jgi:thiamine-phosphate pyrophosphorylase